MCEHKDLANKFVDVERDHGLSGLLQHRPDTSNNFTARCPSLTMDPNVACTSSRSGVWPLSQGRPALPFATIAANGWLISWAIIAAISPIVGETATWARL